MSCGRGGGRRGALAAVVALLAIAGLLGLPGTAAAGAAPFGENAETIRFDVDRITPGVFTTDGPATLTISGRMTNTGDIPLTDLAYRFQRGDALPDSVSLAAELAAPSQPSAVVELTFRSMGADLAPGETAGFAVSAPLTRGRDGSGLGVTEPGVYPLMLNVNATLPTSTGIGRARAGELHLLLTVASVPGAGTDSTTQPGTDPAPAAELTPTPVVSFVPVTDTVHVGVGGVFLDDDLATDIKPGGRLSTLLDQLTALPYPDVVDLLVDPMLLDELTMMTGGYRVVADVGTPQPPLTPPAAPTEAPASSSSAVPSAGSPTQPTSASASAVAPGTTAGPPIAPVAPAGTVAGTGGPAATTFLNRLRTLAARHRIVVLPYGNPDAVAMNRADLQVPLRTSVRRGDEVAEQVLGPDLVTTVAVPPGGAVDGTTAAVLAEAGYRSMVLAGSSVRSTGPLGTAVVALPDDAGGGSLPVLVGDSPVLASMRRVLEGERGDSTALGLNVVAAEIVQQGFDGTGVPISYLPTGDAASFTDDDPQAARRLNELLGQLADAGAVLAGDPAALAAAATAPAELAYGAARGDELPQSYLDHWNDSAAEVSGVSASLRTPAGPDAVDPADLIGELRNAMRPLGSAALRPDQQPGNLILATVDNTLDGIRGGVAIRSTAGSYTLASGSAPLVLTIRNDLPYDVTVRVVLEGAARAGLTVEDPGVILVEAQRNQQVPLPVTVNRSGTFTVEAVLIGADGTQWGDPVELRIRSTAYGAITVVVIAVAGAALLLMVILRIVQRIRQRGNGDDDANGDPDGGADSDGHDPAPDSITAAANHPPPREGPAAQADVDPVGSRGAGRT